MLIRFPASVSGMLALLAISFLVTALCLFPNWDLVSLANDEGIDAIVGKPNSDRVYISFMAALFFGLNLLGLVFQFFTRDRY